jgi:uncharacterized membrane protein YsdA (DUF1294 family)/cold shock CspA family protein
MRYQGKISSWKDEQGFGFITPNGGGKQVFVHITAFTNRHRRPSADTLVTYEVKKEVNGKFKAEQVQYVDAPVRANDGALLLLFALVFLIGMSLSVLAGKLPPFVAWLYFAASTFMFFIYKVDKTAARRDQRRTPEKTLHLLALIGGWPGAIVAQKLFRHKSKKLSFQVIFWTTIILNCAALVYLLSIDGVTTL